MSEILKAFLMGLIQGITEFLPISSSGHLSLFRHFFDFEGASGLFSAMLHIGTLVAVVIYFYKPIYRLFDEFIMCFKDIRNKQFTLNLNKMNSARRMLFMFIISCIPLLILLLPAGDGKNIMDAVDVFSSDDSILAEGICFMVTGFMLLLGSAVSQSSKSDRRILPFSAFLIGVAQFFAACFPGISRSGSTISTGLCLKIRKNDMIAYSFILSVPAVLASGLSEFKTALETDEIIPVLPLIIGVLTAAVVGITAIKLLIKLLQKNKFKYFGYYCMVLGLAVTVTGFIEKFIGVR